MSSTIIGGADVAGDLIGRRGNGTKTGCGCVCGIHLPLGHCVFLARNLVCHGDKN